MLKIAHIAKPVGGVGVYLNLLTKYLDKDKFEHILLYNEDEIKLKSNDFKRLYSIPIVREIRFFTDIKCLITIIRCLKVVKPDRVHCHSAKAGILGRIAGAYLKIPTYYTPHAYSYLSTDKSFKRKLFKSIEKIFRFFPAKTIACSPSEYDRTINDLNFSKEKVRLWNNSIEDNPSTKPSEILKNLPENFICSIGRPSYQKHTELLVKAVIEAKQQQKDIHLVILGVGFYAPSCNGIKKMIEEYSLANNITLVSWLEREETLAILKKSKIYISTSRYEGLPYVVIEALSLSKPCIVTNVDGNKDLVQHAHNGYLVEANETEIVDKIIEILNNEALAQKMSNNSRSLFEENFNIEKNIKKLAQIYFE